MLWNLGNIMRHYSQPQGGFGAPPMPPAGNWSYGAGQKPQWSPGNIGMIPHDFPGPYGQPMPQGTPWLQHPQAPQIGAFNPGEQAGQMAPFQGGIARFRRMRGFNG